jgi:hypothetical protein
MSKAFTKPEEKQFFNKKSNAGFFRRLFYCVWGGFFAWRIQKGYKIIHQFVQKSLKNLKALRVSIPPYVTFVFFFFPFPVAPC